MTEGARSADDDPGSMGWLLARATEIVGRLEGRDSGGASEPPGVPAGDTLRIEGIAWATVELDRAAAELAGPLGLAGASAFEAAPHEALLGASARRAHSAPGVWVVLLEPSTEGRLAAFLARFGEGVAAVYVSRPGDGVGGAVARLRGPLGAERWLAGDRWGPWLIEVPEPEPGRMPTQAAGQAQPASEAQAAGEGEARVTIQP